MKFSQQQLDTAKATLLTVANRPDLIMEKGEGMTLWDTEGKSYLDFVGGWAVASLGHSPQVIRDALAEQAKTLVTASPTYYNRPMLEFAELLTRISGMDRVFFGSSGAEANEGAIKLARKYGSLYKQGAYEIVTTVNGFHGRTLATMSATGKAQWASLFSPKVPGFIHVPLNDKDACLQALQRDTVCAFMLELIQGEGGVREAELSYIQQLRKWCDQFNVLLIVDEIQTGIGRTGKMFACEHYGVEPDVMTLGKGIGGGFPLSALLAKQFCNVFEPGEQGGTYGGQPLAMAVGYAVVSEVLRQNLPRQAEENGKRLLEQLTLLAPKHGLKYIRGKGLLIAFDLPQPVAVEVAQTALRAGLLINAPSAFTIRLVPPLIVTPHHIERMIGMVDEVLMKVLAHK